MADDKRYVPGTFYRLCDMTGFKVRSYDTRKMWTGTIRRTKSWEQRNAQDLIRGRRDEQAVPEPRPRQTDVFIGPLATAIATAANAGDTTLTVDSSARMIVGDVVYIMLDTGVAHRTRIDVIPSATSIQIVAPMPYSAAVGNEIIDSTAYSEPDIG